MLPWPGGAGGGAVAMLACAVVLISLLSFTMRSDLAQQAQTDGEKAFGISNQLAAAASQSRDSATLQQVVDYYRVSVDHYRSATRNAPLSPGADETYARMLELGQDCCESLG